MAAEQYQDQLDSSNDSTALADSHTTDSPTESSASTGHQSQGLAWSQHHPTSLLAADHAAIATNSSVAQTQQLLPGLAPASVPAVASRLLVGTNINIGRRLGSGAFSTVYQAQLGNSNSNNWVVKRLDRVGPDQMQQLSNEVEMLVTAGNHPNLVPFKGWYRDDEGVLCLVLGHCEGGTLATLLKSRSGGADDGLFPEDMVMCWFVQLLLALHHLHARRILHRDLKPENVLLSKNLRVAKLADFEISKQLQADVSLAVTCLGTPHYMSPEVITHRPYTFASDMWALGVVLYEMAARKPAFDARGLPQLVVKILRNAYTPLPLTCSRPLQQLVGLLLRADPDDRPTTTDLLGMSLVRKHLQVLVGLAQGVNRSPAGSGSNRLAAGADGSNLSGLDRGAVGPEDGTPAAAAAASRRKSGLMQPGLATPEGQEVDLGNGASLGLQDMMLALRRMAKAPLHSGSSSPPPRRTRMAAAALHGSSNEGSGTVATQQQGVKRPNSSSSDRVNALANAAGSRSFSNSRDRAPAGSSSTEFTDVEPAASAGASSPSPVAAAAAAAAYAGMPAPVADPNTKRQVVNTWDASAHWEAQQSRQADMRYQAKIMEQRMAREQARQRRKKLDPATAARAAQQQQELDALQQAQQRKQQLGGATSNDVEEISSMSAAAAAAAVAQDEQLELLLQQLRAGGGSSSRASPVPGTARDAAASEPSGTSYDSSDAVSDEIEEEEGLLESGVYEDDVTEDEDYTQALALAAAGDAAADSSGSSYLAASAVADKTLVAAAGKRAWKLVVASLEEDAFDMLLTPVNTAAALPEEDEEEEEEKLEDLAAAAGQCEEQMPLQASSGADADGLPALIQSEDSRLFFSSKSRRGSQRQQQRRQQHDPQVHFDQLEQQLEKALAGSDAAAAQNVISSIYRMSLSVRKAPAAVDKGGPDGHLMSQSPGDTSGTISDTQAGTSGDTAGNGQGPLVTEHVGLWGNKVRRRSAADVERDRRAAAAMEMVINQMFGNVLPDKQSSSEPSTARSLNRTVTGRRVSAPIDTVPMPMTELSSTGLPEVRFQQQQQQQELPAARSTPLGSSSAPNSRRVSSSNSFSSHQQQQQPRLAVIGGLTTSRPVSGIPGSLPTNLPQIRGASPGPGAIQPGTSSPASANSPGRSLPPRPNSNIPPSTSRSSSLRLSQGSEDSSTGTPRVDDALKMLRAETRSAKSGSSGRSSPAPGIGSASVRAVISGGAGTSSGRSSPSPTAAAVAAFASFRAAIPSGGSGHSSRSQLPPAGAGSSSVKALTPGSNGTGGNSSGRTTPTPHAAAVSGGSATPVGAVRIGSSVAGASGHQKLATSSVAAGASKSASAVTAARAVTPPNNSSRDEAVQKTALSKEGRTYVTTTASSIKAVSSSSSSSRPGSTGGSRSRGSSSSGSRAPAAAAGSMSITAGPSEGVAKISAPIRSGSSKVAMGPRPGSSSGGKHSSTGKTAGSGANGSTDNIGRLGSSSGSRTVAGRSR